MEDNRMAKAKKRAKRAKSAKKATKAVKQKARKAVKKAGGRRVRVARATTPPPPIYISGPHGELERCDWDNQQNIYVCKFVNENQAAPAGAILVQRVTQIA
jgi:hypothetical protein